MFWTGNHPIKLFLPFINLTAIATIDIDEVLLKQELLVIKRNVQLFELILPFLGMLPFSIRCSLSHNVW